MTDVEREEFRECERKLAEIGKPYYRFRDGSFIKAKSFEEAKQIKISLLLEEVEEEKGWYACTCLGLDHRLGCPVKEAYGIPF